MSQDKDTLTTDVTLKVTASALLKIADLSKSEDRTQSQTARWLIHKGHEAFGHTPEFPGAPLKNDEKIHFRISDVQRKNIDSKAANEMRSRTAMAKIFLYLGLFVVQKELDDRTDTEANKPEQQAA